jgi:membrane protease subunit HflC
MKSMAITIFVVLIIAILALYLFSFQVREIETALVTTFGKPTRQITEPGWYFKLPTPIQRVYKFDSRMRVFEADLGETTTKGAAPIILNTYVVWKIIEPLRFFNAVGTVREAQSKLYSQISDTQNKVIGQHAFSEFVSSDPSKIRFKQIEDEMLAELRKSLEDANYGIEIKTLGIKQLKISEDVSKDVFERMKAERNRRTEATKAEGDAQARKIESDANLKKEVLDAAARARAMIIKAQGDAEAAQYYKMLEAEPELAIFLRNIDALKEVLKERSTIVLTTDTDIVRLLREMPQIKVVEPNEPQMQPSLSGQ